MPQAFIHADAHFRCGSAHEADGTPCQDYAAARVADGVAALSDGCSTSGRTDVGARLLVLSAMAVLADPERRGDPVPDLIGAVARRVHAAAAPLGVMSEDLDATLGLVMTMPDGGCRALLLGDGVLAVRRPGIGVDATIVTWAGNMPGYPGYIFGSPDRLAEFMRQSASFASAENAPAWRAETIRIPETGAIEILGIEERDPAGGLLGLDVLVDNSAAVDVVAVLSDGAEQINGIEATTAIGEMLAIRAAREGTFVTRRMIRALAGFSKKGSRPVDDISIAALATNPIT